MPNEDVQARAIQAYEDRIATPSSAERQRAAAYRDELAAEIHRIFQEEVALPDDILFGKPASLFDLQLVKGLNGGVAALYPCDVCKEEHSFHINSLVAAGEFYILRDKGELRCTAKPRTPEEQLVDVLREIRDILRTR